MTIKEAAARARKYAHGCRLHEDAMNVLYQGHREAFGEQNPSLDTLWTWIKDYLSMEKIVRYPSHQTPQGDPSR